MTMMPVCCSRCARPIKGFVPPGTEKNAMTMGYYQMSAWKKYANVGDVYVCDRCMWDDPLYIDDYGITAPGALGSD